jgi:hypothetical protein
MANNFSSFECNFSNGRLWVSDTNRAEEVYGSNMNNFDLPFGKESTIKQIVCYTLNPSGVVRHFDVEADGNSDNIYSPYDQDTAVQLASWKQFPATKEDLKTIISNLAEQKQKELDDMQECLNELDSAPDIDTSDSEPDFEKFLDETEEHYDRTEEDGFPGYDIIEYTKEVIKGRWKSAETYMLKRPFLISHMENYAEEVIKGVWPELEELKRQHPEYITNTEE